MFRQSLALVLMVSSNVLAQAPSTQPAATPPINGKLGTPVQLFNGKDLAGWVWYSELATKMEETWTVKNGVMHCTGKPNGYIRTEKDFGPDYVLLIEYRHITQGGGGFLFGIAGPDKIWPKTMQIQGQSGNVGEVVNQGDFNWFVDPARFNRDRIRKIGPVSEKPLGEWNTAELINDHGNIYVTVNGVLQNSATGMDELTGKIGFQSEGAEMEYRKVQLTPIEKK